jgi:hypothetical protein
LASGSSSSFDPTRYDKGKGVLKISWTLEKILAVSFSPFLVGLAKEIGERERERERHGKARVAWPKFEFKFES